MELTGNDGLMSMSRYTPRDVPHKAQQFGVEGMRVEMEMSDAHTVELKEISLETAGTIMCEVSTEAPRFKTAEASSDLTVVQPPSSGPWLSPRPRPDQRFRPGDLLEVNCTSPPSRPQAKLRYFINGQMDDGSHSVEYRKTGPGQYQNSSGLFFKTGHYRRSDQSHTEPLHLPDQGTLQLRSGEALLSSRHLHGVGPVLPSSLPESRYHVLEAASNEYNSSK